MGNTSFSGLLEKYCKSLKPKRILEWGPGESTIMMAKWCPEVQIYTVEHQQKWYDFWLGEFITKNIHKRVKLLLYEGPEDERNDPEWILYTQPLHLDCPVKFDLIFVDGRERVRCMEYAKKVLNSGGVVILHDAQREEYAKGIEMFEVIDETCDTVVMR